MDGFKTRDACTEWLNRIWYSIRNDRLSRNRKQNRDYVLAWVRDKQVRMTPWGPQYLSPERAQWVPYIHGVEQGAICGRWFRERPHRSIHCRGSVLCQTSEPRVGISYCLGDLSYCVQNSFLADPSLDLSKHVAVQVPTTQNDRCRITELPTELLQHIISHLVPQNTTYQFFPSRLDTSRSVQIVQKFTSQPEANEIRPVQYNATNRPPATGSAHMGLAGTCKRLQHQMSSAFFGGNSFILHITGGTIQNAVRSEDLRQFQTWTRILPEQSGSSHSSPWPVTERAASYLRSLVLIVSLPPAPVCKDIDLLEAKVAAVACTLTTAEHLHSLTIDFQQSTQKRDKRYASQILTIDSLQATCGNDGKLTLSIHAPSVQSVPTWNKAQRALKPLLHGPKGVKKVVLSGRISDDLVSQLQISLTSSPVEQREKRAAAGPSDSRPSPAKRRKR